MILAGALLFAIAAVLALAMPGLHDADCDLCR